MTTSVVVPSFNGEVHLLGLMRSLEKQTHSPDEILIVLDGSTDNSFEILSDWEDKLPIRIIRQENRGRSGARNRGVFDSKNEIIIFFDDDMEPQDDSIERHLRFHKSHVDSLLTGFAIEDPSCTKEICLWRDWLHQRWMGEKAQVYKQSDQDLGITAANFSLPRKVFLDIQGFDENVTDCEDYDLAVRAYSKQYSVCCDPLNVAVHNGFNSIVEYASRQRSYRSAYLQLLEKRKHSSFFKFYLRHLPTKSFYKKILYFFIPGSSLKLIDKGFFKFLPNQLRFTIFSRIFAALTIYYPRRDL
ncbi:MAG: glycosyltransferase family 2 protein [Flavobacteriales bacterium]|nr:glycosyltransferase family 2 protein [Flavobacteriales bacterium]